MTHSGMGEGLGWEGWGGGGVRLGLEQVPPRLGKVAADNLGPVRQRQRPCGPLPPHTHTQSQPRPPCHAPRREGGEARGYRLAGKLEGGAPA